MAESARARDKTASAEIAGGAGFLNRLKATNLPAAKVSNSLWYRITLVAGLLLLVSLSMQSAFAHGGGAPQVINEPIGDFVISVWTEPEPIPAGIVHVTIALARENEAILNRDIRVTATPLERGTPVTEPATHDNSANKFLYEADMELTRAGVYRFTIEVDDEMQTASFDAEVAGEVLTDNRFVVFGAVGLVAIVAVFGLLRGKKNGDS